MNLIKRILLRLATMPHTRAFIVGAVDNAEERAHFRGMLVEVFGAGTVGSALAFVLFANVLMGPVQDAPVVGPLADRALPDSGITVAFEPGTGLDVAKYCRAAREVTIDRSPGAEVLGVKRVARNSTLDYIEWQDDGLNTAATRWYVGKDGQQGKEFANVITTADVECMRSVR